MRIAWLVHERGEMYPVVFDSEPSSYYYNDPNYKITQIVYTEVIN
jgi:hypothetical protein